jgi:hypothetical protein
MRYLITTLAILIISCQQNTKDIPPPEIFLAMPENGFEIAPDSTLLISPKITYDYNSTYQWKKNGEILDHSERELSYYGETLQTDVFEFSVMTSAGADSMVIPVHTIVLIDFEEFDLDKNNPHINSSDEGYFNSKGVILPVKNIEEQNYWSGFAISIENDTQDQDLENQFSVFTTAGGAQGSKHFGVFYQDLLGDTHKMVFSDEKNHLLKSISVNNSTYAALAMKRGNDFARAFEENDWFKLSIHGYDKDGSPTDTIHYYLADYRFENKNRRYIVSSWNTVDLQKLGRVNSIEFRLSSSDDEGNYGFNTPLYFCIDDIKILD